MRKYKKTNGFSYNLLRPHENINKTQCFSTFVPRNSLQEQLASQWASQPASQPASLTDRQQSLLHRYPPGKFLDICPNTSQRKGKREGQNSLKTIKIQQNSTESLENHRGGLCPAHESRPLPSTRITPFAQHTNRALWSAHESRPLPSTQITPFAQHTNHALWLAHKSRLLSSTQITPFAEYTNHALGSAHEWRPLPSTRLNSNSLMVQIEFNMYERLTSSVPKRNNSATFWKLACWQMFKLL